MLTEWKLNNFKSIKELSNFYLAPVTILAGANSSGKTVLLQSILLIAQTLSSPAASRPLVLNGEAVKLGTWSDIPHHDLQRDPVAFGCSIELKTAQPYYDEAADRWAKRPITRRRRLSEDITAVTLFGSFSSTRGKVDAGSDPVVDKIELSVEKAQTTREQSLVQQSLSVRRRKKARSERELAELTALMPQAAQVESLRYIVTETPRQGVLYLDEDTDYMQEMLLSTRTIGVTFRHFLPRSMVQKYDATARQLADNIRNLLSPWNPTAVQRQSRKKLGDFIEKAMFAGSKMVSDQFVDRLNVYLDAFDLHERFEGQTTSDFTKFISSLSNRMRSYPRSTSRSVTQLALLLSLGLEPFVAREARQSAVEITPVPSFALDAASLIEDFFVNRVRYLGPLRDDPRVIYGLPPTPDIPDVGIKGQYTAVVLDRNKERLIDFIDPVSRELRHCSLQEAVVTWLQHMRILDSVSTQEAGKLGYKLSVYASDLDRELDLTMVGVGASQVLPILVMALLAPPGTLLIFEQPEIHLHPRVQSILGDFFLYMGQLGKQCLVETHSEYLVNRIRDRIAEAKKDEILKVVKMYFVQRDGNESHFREVQPNEYGAILDWPAGFFDEGTSQAESIIKHATQKRTKEKQDRAQ